MGEITGCNSYRLCPRCGATVYFNEQSNSKIDQQAKILEKNYEKTGDPRPELTAKTMSCSKCGYFPIYLS